MWLSVVSYLYEYGLLCCVFNSFIVLLLFFKFLILKNLILIIIVPHHRLLINPSMKINIWLGALFPGKCGSGIGMPG
jgi:hypothetical protein